MNEKLKNKILELHEKYGNIKIRCQWANDLPIDAILDMQGDLKKITIENLIRLCSSIFINGFCAPFFVWDNKGAYMALDGNQRLKAICAIREAGVSIPGTAILRQVA